MTSGLCPTATYTLRLLNSHLGVSECSIYVRFHYYMKLVLNSDCHCNFRSLLHAGSRIQSLSSLRNFTHYTRKLIVGIAVLPCARTGNHTLTGCLSATKLFSKLSATFPSAFRVSPLGKTALSYNQSTTLSENVSISYSMKARK